MRFSATKPAAENTAAKPTPIPPPMYRPLMPTSLRADPPSKNRPIRSGSITKPTVDCFISRLFSANKTAIRHNRTAVLFPSGQMRSYILPVVYKGLFCSRFIFSIPRCAVSRRDGWPQGIHSWWYRRCRHALPGEPVHIVILIPEATLTVELTGQSAGDVVLIEGGMAVGQVLHPGQSAQRVIGKGGGLGAVCLFAGESAVAVVGQGVNRTVQDHCVTIGHHTKKDTHQSHFVQTLYCTCSLPTQRNYNQSSICDREMELNHLQEDYQGG